MIITLLKLYQKWTNILLISSKKKYARNFNNIKKYTYN